MVVASSDTVTITDLALAAYRRALEPKRLALIPGGHFDPISTSFLSLKLPQQNGLASICSTPARELLVTSPQLPSRR
jgi:hypothetical protein